MTHTNKPLNVLFLCTHNSARSILAEALLNAMGHGRFQAYSAGSSPRENQKPHPLGLQVLQKAGISTEALRSKSWDEFATPRAKSARSGPGTRPRPIGATPIHPKATRRTRKNSTPSAIHFI
jgi:hypothetical protein